MITGVPILFDVANKKFTERLFIMSRALNGIVSRAILYRDAQRAIRGRAPFGNQAAQSSHQFSRPTGLFSFEILLEMIGLTASETS
jgi:hypothetical protein